MRANLILHDGVPDAFREFTHSLIVCVVFLVTNCGGKVG